MTQRVPTGFRFAGMHCGIKQDSSSEDLMLVTCDADSVGAGVYTQNLVFAAPVTLDRERTPSPRIRAVVCNSGNANACTGPQGLEDAREMARVTAQATGVEPEQVLVLSTGIIGNFLPMEKIRAGIQALAGKTNCDETSLVAAARGMMTTDTVHKISHRGLSEGDRAIRITGLAKGAAMIGPNMATMLCVLLTDAPLAPDVAQDLLKNAVDDSFNCLSVEGHMSTNDTVLLLSSGTAGGDSLTGKAKSAFAASLGEVCDELARSIADDGEGTTHVINLQVEGCATREAARQIARTVANSALVKTAIAGADPNWGRIVSAAGYAEVPFDPQGVSLRVQGHLLYEQGQPVEFDEPIVSAAIKDQRETSIVLRFKEGTAGVRFWTTDLTAEYVRLNADYHT